MSLGAQVAVAVVGALASAALIVPINRYLARLRSEQLGVRNANPFEPGIVGALLGLAVAVGAPSVSAAIPLLVAAAGAAAVTVTDWISYRIANRLLFPTVLLATAAMVAVAVADSDSAAIGRAAVGCVLFFAMLGLVRVALGAATIGLGDVKLGALLGLAVGWGASDIGGAVQNVIASLFVASVAGLLVGTIVGLARRKYGPILASPEMKAAGESTELPPLMQTPFPFGPALVGAAFLVIAVA